MALHAVPEPPPDPSEGVTSGDTNWLGEACPENGPYGIRFEDNAAVVPKGLPVDAWREVIADVRRADRGATWWAVDFFVYARDEYGLKLKQIADLSGYRYGYVRNAVSDLDRIARDNRDVPVKSFGVYRVAARLEDQEQQREALEIARAEGLSGRGLSRRLRSASGPPAGSEPPNPKRKRTSRDELWATLLAAGLEPACALANIVWDMLGELDAGGVAAVLELEQRRQA